VTTPIHRGTNARYSDTATRNIESILKLEKKDQEALSPYHRLSHAIGWFVGTVYFVVFECAMVLGWIAFNVGLAPTATKVLKMLGEIAVHLKLLVHDPDNKISHNIRRSNPSPVTCARGRRRKPNEYHTIR
jgi:hypothetical protein